MDGQAATRPEWRAMSDSCDLIVRGGTLATPDAIALGDLAIRGGKIVAVGDVSGFSAAEELDATGLHVLPGAIDTQVHFREPGMEHKEDLESGTRCALMGGVTTIFEMPNTNPTTITAEALYDKLQRCEGRAWVDHGFFIGASPENVDELATLEQLPGVPGVKTFMGSSTGSLLVEEESVLRRVMQNGVRPMPVHSEDEARLRERKVIADEAGHPRAHPIWRDPESAVISTKRLIRLSEETGRHVHILHISTADELPLIAEAKRRGLRVTCEATPHHLTLEAAQYETLGTYLQMNPPVRDETHRRAIWAAVKEGLFDVFGSDHAPHTHEEKAKPYPASPSGMPGVQTIYPVMLHWAIEGELPLRQAIDMLTSRPADLYGIRDKGRLVVGADADLAVFDLNAQFTLTNEGMETKCGWTPYHGMTIRARPIHTLVRGHWAMREGARPAAPIGRPVSFTWK